MAVTTSPFLNDILEQAFVVDTDADATVEQNIRGGETTLYQAYVDNSANAAVEYLKIWDSKNATIGTDAPDFQFLIPASSRVTIGFGTSGEDFTNGLSFAVTDAPGTTAGANPGSDVIVRMVCT